MVVTYEAYLQLSLLGKQGRILKVTGEIDRRNFKLGDLTFQTPLTVDQIVKVPRNLFRHINAVGTSFDLECKVRDRKSVV